MTILRRWWWALAWLPAAALILAAPLLRSQPRFTLRLAAYSSPIVEKMPRCLSMWREIPSNAPGRFVMIYTAKVTVPAEEIRVVDDVQGLMAIVHTGEERSWTCDWPERWVPGFSGDST